MRRTGCIYQEVQRNTGHGTGEFSAVRYVRGVGAVRGGRLSWVAEIIYHRKRYRFRSTNLDNAQHWLSMMSEKFSD